MMDSVKFFQPNEEGIVARVTLDYEGVLFRKIEVREDKDGNLFVEYPTHIRTKQGKIVLDPEGKEIKDYVFRPLKENFDFFDTLVINTYLKHLYKYTPDLYTPYELPNLAIEEISAKVSPIMQLDNGIVAFASLIYKGILVNDIAIFRTRQGRLKLVYPHYSQKGKAADLQLLYMYPHKPDVLTQLRNVVLDEYDEVYAKSLY